MIGITNYTISNWIFACILLALLSTCGTTERTTDRNGIPSRRDLPPSDTSSPPSEEEHKTPPTKVLVSPADLDAEALKMLEQGRASWYGSKFEGRLTASGEEFDMHAMTAAHRTLPFNTLVLVKNLDTGKSATVRINDRGPFAKDRIIDLSKEAAQKIGMIGSGTARVELYVPKQSVGPSHSTNLATPTFTVQLGSFDSEAQAFNHSSKIKGSRVEIVRLNNETIYRVYYGLFIDKETAYRKQRELEQRNFSGFVKQIENS